MMGDMVRPGYSMIIGPLLYFSCCEVSSLLRNNVVWNAMMGDTVFCKSMDGSLNMSIVIRKGKCITRISVYCSKDKTLFFSLRKWFHVVNLLQDLWLVTLGNSATSGTQYWSLLQAYLVLSSGCFHVCCGEWESMFSNTCLTSISATMSTVGIQKSSMITRNAV